MRAASRLFVPLATVIVVTGSGLFHAAFIGHYPFVGWSRLAWYLTYIVLLTGAAEALGIPNIPRRLNALGSSVAAALLAAGGMSFVQLLVATPVLPRFVVFVSAAVLIPTFTALCAFTERIHVRAAGRDRVLVIVDGEDEILRLQREIDRAPERPSMVVAGYTTDELADHEGSNELVERCLSQAATVLVLDRVAQENRWIIAQAGALHAQGVRIRTLSMFYDQWLGKLPVNELERISLLFDINGLHSVRYLRAKRTLDILAALMGILALALVAPVVLVCNRFANRGPLFYRQPRVGQHGTEFVILKLRTMPPDQHGGQWTTVDDPRLGKFCRFLRRSHLDELPQVLNVLRRELSVVGPRPEQPRYVSELGTTIPFYDLRHLVLPGMTGWAQIKYSYGASALDSLEKLQYDFFYLRHQSLGLDLRIIGRTANSVLRRTGR